MTFASVCMDPKRNTDAFAWTYCCMHSCIPRCHMFCVSDSREHIMKWIVHVLLKMQMVDRMTANHWIYHLHLFDILDLPFASYSIYLHRSVTYGLPSTLFYTNTRSIIRWLASRYWYCKGKAYMYTNRFIYAPWLNKTWPTIHNIVCFRESEFQHGMKYALVHEIGFGQANPYFFWDQCMHLQKSFVQLL